MYVLIIIWLYLYCMWCGKEAGVMEEVSMIMIKQDRVRRKVEKDSEHSRVSYQPQRTGLGYNLN